MAKIRALGTCVVAAGGLPDGELNRLYDLAEIGFKDRKAIKNMEVCDVYVCMCVCVCVCLCVCVWSMVCLDISCHLVSDAYTLRVLPIPL